MTTTQTAEQIIAALEAEQIDTVRRDVLNHDAAAMLRSQAAEIERLRRARNLYEAALLAQNQQGAIGEVFELWNAARAALEKQV